MDVLIFLFLDRSRVYARNSMTMSAHTPMPYPQTVLMMLCIAKLRTASRGTLHPCNSPWHAWQAVSELDHWISRVPRSDCLKFSFWNSTSISSVIACRIMTLAVLAVAVAKVKFRSKMTPLYIGLEVKP